MRVKNYAESIESAKIPEYEIHSSTFGYIQFAVDR